MKHVLREKILTLLIILIPATALQASVSFAAAPIQEGERLVYHAKWGSVTAGEAVIETLPIETIQGRKSYHFAMTAKTSPRVDSFYPIRERQDSFTDLELTRTLFYAKRRTGHHPRDIVVNFDWHKLTATFVNGGEPQQPVTIVPGTLDPLALIFYIRSKKLEVGEALEIPMTDGKRCASVKATVTGRETLTIDDRTYDSVVVVPEMESLSWFLRKGRALKLWYSADEQKIPLRMQSQLAIGTFVFELVMNKS